MFVDSVRSRHACFLVLPAFTLLLLAACNKQAATPPVTAQPQPQAAASPSISADGLPAAPSNVISLPMGFKRDTGDLDVMVKRRRIRALVILNPIGFFYDKGKPKGAMYETLDEFQKFVNQKLKTRQTADNSRIHSHARRSGCEGSDRGDRGHCRLWSRGDARA